MDLATFFAQGLHGDGLVDYAVGRVERAGGRRSGGQAVRTVRTVDGQAVMRMGDDQVEVLRKAPGQASGRGVGHRRPATPRWCAPRAGRAGVGDGVAPARSRSRSLLDPRVRTHDWNMLNNDWRRGFLWPIRGPRRSGTSTPGSRADRARPPDEGWLPTAWYNDAGGVTLGLRSRRTTSAGSSRTCAVQLRHRLGE